MSPTKLPFAIFFGPSHFLCQANKKYFVLPRHTADMRGPPAGTDGKDMPKTEDHEDLPRSKSHNLSFALIMILALIKQGMHKPHDRKDYTTDIPHHHSHARKSAKVKRQTYHLNSKEVVSILAHHCVDKCACKIHCS